MDEDPSIKRRLVAIFTADIAGYSRLMGEDDAATARALKGHQAVILPLIGRYGGYVIDTAGDGILAEFPSVIGAAECAVEIQTVMATRNAEVPEHRDHPPETTIVDARRQARHGGEILARPGLFATS